MVTLRQTQMVNLVEHSYFSNIDFRHLGTVLDCFAHDAVLTVNGRRHRNRDGEIKHYFERLLADFRSIRHEGLAHEIDVEAQRLTSRYTLRLGDADGRSREARGRAAFRLEKGKLAEVVVEGDDGPMA